MISRPHLDDLSGRLGHRFTDSARLQLALTHRSWCAEHNAAESNERLEFLGDAVLGLVVTDHLYATHPELPEGHLAKIRASVVNAATLAELARELDLGAGLLLGKGEEASGGRNKGSILCDAMEAVIGAVHLDAGYEAARQLVLDLLRDRIAASAVGPGVNDHKTQLQELAVQHFGGLPRYSVSGVGPDHDKRFTATVSVGGDLRGQGEGRSKKEAEQAAAEMAWAALIHELDESQSVEELSEVGSQRGPR